jgi:hypothetical protein
MAVLSADVLEFAVDAEVDSLILPLRAAVADIFYRGGLTWDSATGIICSATTDALLWRGVTAERTTTTAANDRVRCYAFGHFHWNNTNFTIANEGIRFRQANAEADNPASIVITAAGAGFSGAIGVLTTVETTATDGWVLASPLLQD